MTPFEAMGWFAELVPGADRPGGGEAAEPDEADDRPARLALRAAGEGALRRTLVEAYSAMRLDWGGARAAQGRVLRAARALGSSERRFAGDLLTLLVRHERTIALLCARAGLASGAAREKVSLARVQAALVVAHGVPRSELGRRLGVDWEAVADPVHTLTGWVMATQPADAEVFGVAASLPDWLAGRLLELDDARQLGAALNRRGPLCLRVNRTRTTRAAALAELRAQGFPDAAPTALATDGIRLGSRVDVNAIEAVRSGALEVQDEGSQLIAELCAPQPGWRVVDACAGALGKSLGLASLMEGRGSILALDPRADALERGAKRARRAGFTSIRTKAPERAGEPDGRADLVLVDAPCTGTGALRRRPWSRWALSPLEPARMAALQGEILRRAARWAAPSGRVVYATCSLLGEENDGVVDRFLAEVPGWRQVPASELLGAERAERIGDGRVLKLYPHRHDTDGFFAAALVRL